MSSLKSGSGSEDWYHLTGVTPIGEWGSLRLKIRYLHDLIMPEEEYSPLKELLLDSKLDVVRALADLCHSDRNPLATSLLRVFRFDKKEADLLSTLNRLEVEREEETSTLFRAASLTTTLMDLYMKSVCTEFLHTAIFPTIHRCILIKIILIFLYVWCQIWLEFLIISKDWSKAGVIISNRHSGHVGP